ncbi:MAG: YceI family protein [Nitrospiraceae bacterium]|nr:MAG: YceI family protein [Nitrospiraceae bacterium]
MPKWVIDPDHSVGAFSIRHMMIAHVHGQMNRVSGTVHLDTDDITSLTVELEIDISSILTGIQKRDDHLKSQDFFNIERYPKITFRSSNAERTGFNICQVSGEITIHGTTLPLSLEVVISGPVKSPFGETSIGLTVRTTLNREDFGMTWNEPMEKDGLMVGREVDISVNIEADLTPE